MIDTPQEMARLLVRMGYGRAEIEQAIVQEHPDCQAGDVVAAALAANEQREAAWNETIAAEKRNTKE